MMRKLVYYVAASVDGYIADRNGDFSDFPQRPDTLKELFARYPETCPVHVMEALGVAGEARRFDAVIMGRRTHQPALDAGLLDGGYPHLAQYVVTHEPLPPSSSGYRIDRDPAGFITHLKRQSGKDIWLCGGGNLAAQLLDEIDEIQIKVNPILLGEGIPLIRGSKAPLPLLLVESEQLPGGIVLNTYRSPKA